ncbi:hypothetical protein Tco_0519865 [Tanacetum coccineum]
MNNNEASCSNPMEIDDDDDDSDDLGEEQTQFSDVGSSSKGQKRKRKLTSKPGESLYFRHDLPFSFSEYKGFKTVFEYLQPSVSHITRNTTKADIIKLYEHERNRLRGELIRSPGRISFTSDAWTSIVTDGYLSLGNCWYKL